MWQGRAGATSRIMEVQPSHLIPSLPPSEGEMAAWLCPVVRGDELVVTGPDDDHNPRGLCCRPRNGRAASSASQRSGGGSQAGGLSKDGGDLCDNRVHDYLGSLCRSVQVIYVYFFSSDPYQGQSTNFS